MRRSATLAAAAAALSLAVGVAQPAAADTYYCKIVTAQSVNVYWHSTGDAVHYQFLKDVIFHAAHSKNGRYEALTFPTRDEVRSLGWVTTNPAYTDPCRP